MSLSVVGWPVDQCPVSSSLGHFLKKKTHPKKLSSFCFASMYTARTVMNIYIFLYLVSKGLTREKKCWSVYVHLMPASN